MDAGLIARYFIPAHKGLLRLADGLRAAARWEVRDLFAGLPGTDWDLAFCRNLMIYIESEAAGRAWRILRAALRPGGYLVVGKSERPTAAGLRRAAPCIYRVETEARRG
jgi:chemotaxis methyl-accepting protein methylase